MKNTLFPKKPTLFYVLLIAFAFVNAQENEKKALPSCEIKNMDGETINILNYAQNGKITVFSFWATWCKPCIKELNNVADHAEDWAETYNVEVVANSIDVSRNIQKVKPLVNGLGWDYDILLDPNGDLQRKMNVTNPPVTFLVDLEGNIVYTHTGYLEGDEYELEDEIKKLIRKE